MMRFVIGRGWQEVEGRDNIDGYWRRRRRVSTERLITIVDIISVIIDSVNIICCLFARSTGK